MSAKLSLAALAALAVATFETNTVLEKVYATSDGNIFISENYARNHGRQEKLEVYPITRAEALATATEAGAGDDEGEDDSANKGESGTTADQGGDGAPAPPAPATPAAATPAPAAPKPKKATPPAAAA